MKNKLFWPIAVLAVVIIVESILLMSGNQTGMKINNPVDVTPTEEAVVEDAVSFSWSNEADGKAVLILTAKKKVAIDAIDLYIAYKGTKINSVKNLDELPKPTFSKVSSEKSLVVMNYLIPEDLGFNVEEGQSVRVVQLDLTIDPTKVVELSIDPKTQVVENGSVKVLPFNSQKLVINSATL